MSLAAAALMATGLVGASAANAATGYARCPSGYLCVFSGYKGTGGMAWFRYGSPDLRQQGMDNRVLSARNLAGRYSCGHDYYNYRGYLWMLTNDASFRAGLNVEGGASSVKVGC